MKNQNEPIIKNVCQCKICGASADRYSYGFQCQVNPSHMADLNVGIWSDLTYPADDEPKTINNLAGKPPGSFAAFLLDQKAKWAEYNERQRQRARGENPPPLSFDLKDLAL